MTKMYAQICANGNSRNFVLFVLMVALHTTHYTATMNMNNKADYINTICSVSSQ